MEYPARYVNHRGEEVEFSSQSNNHYIATNAFDYQWTARKIGSTVQVLTREPKEITLEVIWCDDRDRLYEVLDADSSTSNFGRLYVGNSYTECFPRAASASVWCELEEYMRDSLTFTERSGGWLHDVVERRFDAGGAGDIGNLDYGMDYASGSRGGFDYGNFENTGFDYDYNAELTRTIEYDAVGNPDMKIVIFGPASSPTVLAGGNRYKVNLEITEGQRIEIDTREKTCVLVLSDGTRETALASADGDFKDGSGSYIFQKAPVESCRVTWDGTFSFDMIMTETRSRPRWNW